MSKRNILSPTQIECLKQLRHLGGWQDAYTIRFRLSTLYALLKQKLVERSGFRPGDMLVPRVNINWRITQLGLNKLTEIEKKGSNSERLDRQG